MKITTSKQLSAYIQDIRQSQGLSQAIIGEKIGLRQGTVSNFEQNPDSSKLATLFKLLSVLELEIELKPRKVSDENSSDNSRWTEEW